MKKKILVVSSLFFCSLAAVTTSVTLELENNTSMPILAALHVNKEKVFLVVKEGILLPAHSTISIDLEESYWFAPVVTGGFRGNKTTSQVRTMNALMHSLPTQIMFISPNNQSPVNVTIPYSKNSTPTMTIMPYATLVKVAPGNERFSVKVD